MERAQEVADGRITLRTMGDALKAKAVNIAQHANTHDAKEWFKAKVAGVTSWAAKPGIEQAEDVAEQAGDVMVPHPASVAAAIVTGGLGRGALRLADEAAGVGKLSKTARSAAKVQESLAEHLSPAVRPTAGSDARVPGRHGAFRQAKRDAGIPSHQHPEKITKTAMTDRWNNKIFDEHGKEIYTREYEFSRPGQKSVIIQEHSAGHKYGQGGIGDQGPHFNIRPVDKVRTGKVAGTKEHYSFNRGP